MERLLEVTDTELKEIINECPWVVGKKYEIP